MAIKTYRNRQRPATPPPKYQGPEEINFKTPPATRRGTTKQKSFPTPLKPRLGGFSMNTLFTKAVVDPLLKSDLMNCLQTGLPIEDFVRAIWGYNPEDLNWEINKGKLRLEKTHIDDYRAAFTAEEEVRYIPLTSLMDTTRENAQKVLKIHSPCPVTFEPLGSTNIHGKNKNNRKPDVAIMAEESSDYYRDVLDKTSHKERIQWRPIPCFIECKRGVTRATARGTTVPGRNCVSTPAALVHDPGEEQPSRRKRKITSMQNIPVSSKRRKHVSFMEPTIEEEEEYVAEYEDLDENIDTEEEWEEEDGEGEQDDGEGDDDEEEWEEEDGEGEQDDGEGDDDEQEGEEEEEEEHEDMEDTEVAEEDAVEDESTSDVEHSDVEVVHIASDPGPSKARCPPRGVQLGYHELQAASYALECLADGCRRYVTGIMVKDFQVSLWYYDRLGVIKSEEFNFEEDHRLWNLVIVALSSCNMDEFGFEPMIHPPSDISPPVSLIKPTRVQPPRNITGWEIRIDEGMDVTGTRVSESVRLKICAPPVYVQYGIVGRGTSVFSVSPTDNAHPCLGSSEDLVVKFSWPAATRVNTEDGLIRRIRKRIGVHSKHVTGLRMSTTLSGLRLGLPRLDDSIKKLSGKVEDRVLRVLVCDRHFPLTDLKTLKEFKNVFIDLVRAHRIVYKRGYVLHRDLSVNNVMFSRDRFGKAYGVLNDWDLSADVKGTTGVGRLASARHRTGTAPFMAIELLEKPDSSPHYYRHDLESFFYILIWSSCSFLLNGKELKTRRNFLDEWTRGNWESIGSAKSKFLRTLNDDFPSLTKGVTVPFKPLLDLWLKPLAELMCRACAALFYTRSVSDKATIDGVLTYRVFMETLGVDFSKRPYRSEMDLL